MVNEPFSVLNSIPENAELVNYMGWLYYPPLERPDAKDVPRRVNARVFMKHLEESVEWIESGKPHLFLYSHPKEIADRLNTLAKKLNQRALDGIDVHRSCAGRDMVHQLMDIYQDLEVMTMPLYTRLGQHWHDLYEQGIDLTQDEREDFGSDIELLKKSAAKNNYATAWQDFDFRTSNRSGRKIVEDLREHSDYLLEKSRSISAAIKEGSYDQLLPVAEHEIVIYEKIICKLNTKFPEMKSLWEKLS